MESARATARERAAPTAGDVAPAGVTAAAGVGAVARHDAGFTRASEDQVAWLGVRTNKTAVLDRAYLLTQPLRQIYRVPADHAVALLDA
ncbi:MAG: hypothetical protein JO179_18740 [Solirubrobacterales bacterium]|nr:hypothetical protein [Solirubrobacterales bacterium]